MPGSASRHGPERARQRHDDAEDHGLYRAQTGAGRGARRRTRVSETTIRRWRGRTTISDRSHTPKHSAISLSPLEEALVCELRTQLWLPLDDITEVMRRSVNATGSGVDRRKMWPKVFSARKRFSD